MLIDLTVSVKREISGDISIDSPAEIHYNDFLMDCFKIGDKVIYPNQGIGLIQGIQVESYNGESFRVYCIKILANNALVLVPSCNAEEIGIRKLSSENSIRKLFDYMKNGTVDVTMNWKGRYKEHINLMKTGTILDMILVLKSLYYLSTIKPLSFREKKMMEKAKELIITEISEASCLPCSRIEQKVNHSLASCFKTIKPSLDI